MLIGYGFPKVLNAGLPGKNDDPECEWIYIGHDLHYIVAVSSSSVQLWSAGLHRVRLSQVVRNGEEIGEDGTNVCAHWCPSKATLAVLVSGVGRLSDAPFDCTELSLGRPVGSRHQPCTIIDLFAWGPPQDRGAFKGDMHVPAHAHGFCATLHAPTSAPHVAGAMQTSRQYIHIYALYAWKEPLASGSAPSTLLARTVPKVDVYLRNSVQLDLGSIATTLSGDSRLILLGCADGTVAALAWTGKVCEYRYLACTLPPHFNLASDG